MVTRTHSENVFLDLHLYCYTEIEERVQFIHVSDLPLIENLESNPVWLVPVDIHYLDRQVYNIKTLTLTPCTNGNIQVQWARCGFDD